MRGALGDPRLRPWLGLGLPAVAAGFATLAIDPAQSWFWVSNASALYLLAVGLSAVRRAFVTAPDARAAPPIVVDIAANVARMDRVWVTLGAWIRVPDRRPARSRSPHVSHEAAYRASIETGGDQLGSQWAAAGSPAMLCEASVLGADR